MKTTKVDFFHTLDTRDHDELLLSYFPDIVSMRLKFYIGSLDPLLAKYQSVYFGKTVFTINETADLMHILCIKCKLFDFFLRKESIYYIKYLFT